MKRILIANRGEIALRYRHAAEALGLEAIRIFAEDEAEDAGRAFGGGLTALKGKGAKAYLDQAQVLDAAVRENCDAGAVGYGFLSENADFAAAVEAKGLTFIGPAPATLRRLGGKDTARALAAEAGVPVAPSTLCELVGLPKPTVHRLLHTAETEGFLQRSLDGRSYGPGKRMRKLSTNTLSSQRIRTERLRVMRDLASDVGETCNLAAPGRDGMVYLDRVETHWPLRIQLPVGTQVPFHCTASGKMYLSTLQPRYLKSYLSAVELQPYTRNSKTAPESLTEEVRRIRALGYSTDDQEFMVGMAAIAVPVWDDLGRLLSTLSVHAPVQRNSVNELKDHLPLLQDAAEQLRLMVID